MAAAIAAAAIAAAAMTPAASAAGRSGADANASGRSGADASTAAESGGAHASGAGRSGTHASGAGQSGAHAGGHGHRQRRHRAHYGRRGRSRGRSGASRSRSRALRSSDLWATINFCSPGTAGEEGEQTKRPSIGIRGSMPPDGHPKDAMLMRFSLQYMLEGSSKWHDLSGEAGSGFVEAGNATGVRQAGRSFHLRPLAKGESFRLRGMVEFQWRHEGRVVLTATRLTTSGHHSSSGARPKGFSAATCEIG